LARRVRERDEAEARLTAICEVSRQSASVEAVEELQEIALAVPSKVGLTRAAASLVVQESPRGPWRLAGTAGLQTPEIEALRATVTDILTQGGCNACREASLARNPDCPLLHTLRGQLLQEPRFAFCLSLSREASRRVLLSMFLPEGAYLPARIPETLESIGSGLAIALDRARLKARERQSLQQIERAVRTEQIGLIPTLQRILIEVATEHAIAAGAVYLLRRDNDGSQLAPVASWPTQDASTLLLDNARAAMLSSANPRAVGVGSPGVGAMLGVAPGMSKDRVAATPLTSDGEVLGALVFADQDSGCCLPDPSIMGVVASMMALLIRNSQLYALLQSQAVLDERNHVAREVHDRLAQSLGYLNFKIQHVQLLLARGQIAESSTAMQELRDGSQEVYAEVRLMIQELRSTTGDQGGLAQRLLQYGSVFAERTGLEVTVSAIAEPNLSPYAQGELFRVVQEALANVYRHAQARRATVRLGRDPDGVTLVVEDDGGGMESVRREDGDHFGLRIMRERVQSIGGELKIVSRPGGGTTVHVHVPTERVRE
jgi:signal transduction histidine kinase